MAGGLEYRLGRIFGTDGRAMVVPVDHGLNLGRVEGLEDPEQVALAGTRAGCDGLLMSVGLARRMASSLAERGSPARLLTLDTLHGTREDHPGCAALVASVEQAVRLGADAVKLLMVWDVEPEEQAGAARRAGAVLEEAARWDMPVMLEPVAMRTPRGPEAAAIEAHGARVAAELGADIIKVGYPGTPEGMHALSSELGVPVVILGGPSAGTAEELAAMVGDAVGAGAAGIVVGRRVWQRQPAERSALMSALVDLVHGRCDAAGAVARLAEPTAIA